MSSVSSVLVPSPAPGLLPYQAEFAQHPARFKIALWARQTGKDFTAAAEAVEDCHARPGATWLILSAGERQGLETLAKAREWAEQMGMPAAEFAEQRPSEQLSGARAAELSWKNGSRILALPANAQTVRGYSGNVILSEFAFHENPEAIWQAIYPSISNPLHGGEKKLRIISTPNGLNNKFSDLWRKAEDYFKSKVTIHDAISQGLPLNAAELERHLGDAEAWRQEYLCEFADTAEVLLPYEWITPCESRAAVAGSSLERFLQAPRRGRLVAGLDFGRRNHLTVCWILEEIPASLSPLVNPGAAPLASLAPLAPLASMSGAARYCYVTRDVLALKACSTPEQLEQLRPRLRLCQRVCLDATGAGIGLGDYLVKEFGEHVAAGRPGGIARSGKVELCAFTAGLKNELFPKLRAAFEQREVAIPIEREIREDLHAIHRRVSADGRVSYRAHDTLDGHADRATALALALRAAKG